MSVEATILWRKNLKKRCAYLFGSACVLCGYSNCLAALEFHHLDPTQKDFQISEAYSNPKAWALVVEELRKCTLLCANCHREVHYNNLYIENKQYITGETDYRLWESTNYHKCTCGKVIHKRNNSCSDVCAKKLRQKIDWLSEKDNILRLKDDDNISFVKIAVLYNTSDKTIAKWYTRFKS